MTIQSAFTSDRMCLALTGMTVFEFNNLLPGFSTTLKEAQRARNTQRIRAFGGGRTGLLPTPAHKLFAALVYMKVYPTYDVLSFFCALTAPGVSVGYNFFFRFLLKRSAETSSFLGDKSVPLRNSSGSSLRPKISSLTALSGESKNP